MSSLSTGFVRCAWVAALTVAALGCGGPSRPSTTPVVESGSTKSHEDQVRGHCPVAVPGTSVAVEDTATGAAFVFVTTSDVGELRKRVGAIAAIHNEHHGAMGPLPDGRATDDAHDHAAHAHGDGARGASHHHDDHTANTGAGDDGHVGKMIGVHSKAVATDIEGGARLELVVAAADVGTIQGELRKHAAHLATGRCEMKHDHHAH